MEEMKIKVRVVVCEIRGKWGIGMMEGIVGGEGEGKRVAEVAEMEWKSGKEEIGKGVEGKWEEEVMFVVREKYDSLKDYCREVGEWDGEVEKVMEK